MYILLKIILGSANLKRFPVVLHLGVAVFKFVIWGGISLDIRSEIFLWRRVSGAVKDYFRTYFGRYTISRNILTQISDVIQSNIA